MTTPAGWYPDPADPASLRWYDGAAWTPQTRPAVDAPAAAGAPAAAPEPPVLGAPPAVDVVGAPQPRRGGLRKALAVGAAGVAALGVAGGAYAFSALSGGGAQPEDALPAGTVAYGELDLDPAAGQKLAVFRLAQRFPRAGVESEDGVRDDLLAQVVEDALPEGTSYERDVAPWVGRRAGLAVLDSLDDAGEPQVVVAVQHRDEGAAKEALRRIAGAAEEPFAFALGADGYVLLGEEQAVVDRAVEDAQEAPLSGSSAYTSAVEELGGDQLATFFVDLEGVAQVLPQASRDQLTEADLDLSGRIVVGASAAARHLEITGRTLDVRTGQDRPGTVGERAGTALLRAMPSDAVAAFSATGLGTGLSTFYAQLQGKADQVEQEAGLGGDLSGLTDVLEQYDLDLPEDLEAVFGTEAAAAVFGEEPDVAARVAGGDPQRVLEIVRRLDESGASAELVRAEGDDLLVGSRPEALARLDGQGGLGEAALFRDALPDAEQAGFAVFVDAQRALGVLDAQGATEGLEPEDRADLEELGALGITATGSTDGAFRIRLTLR